MSSHPQMYLMPCSCGITWETTLPAVALGERCGSEDRKGKKIPGSGCGRLLPLPLPEAPEVAVARRGAFNAWLESLAVVPETVARMEVAA
jgi:hypothetical protein